MIFFPFILKTTQSNELPSRSLYYHSILPWAGKLIIGWVVDISRCSIFKKTSQKVIKTCFLHTPSCFVSSSDVDYVNFRRIRLKMVLNFHAMAGKQQSNIHGWRSDPILQFTFYKLDNLTPFSLFSAHNSCSQLFFATSCGIQTWLDLPEILMKTSLSKLFRISLFLELFLFWKSVKGSNLQEKYTISFQTNTLSSFLKYNVSDKQWIRFKSCLFYVSVLCYFYLWCIKRTSFK